MHNLEKRKCQYSNFMQINRKCTSSFLGIRLSHKKNRETLERFVFFLKDFRCLYCIIYLVSFFILYFLLTPCRNISSLQKCLLIYLTKVEYLTRSHIIHITGMAQLYNNKRDQFDSQFSSSIKPWDESPNSKLK